MGFESASGQAVIRLYEGLQDMIKERRRDNPNYGEYFEWLYRKCKSKKKTIKKRHCNRACSSQELHQFFEPEGIRRNRVLQLWYER